MVFRTFMTLPILDSTIHTNKAKVEKLIGEGVQLFDNLSPILVNTHTNIIQDRKRVA